MLIKIEINGILIEKKIKKIRVAKNLERKNLDRQRFQTTKIWTVKNSKPQNSGLLKIWKINI
jgi:hypothetical protein